MTEYIWSPHWHAAIVDDHLVVRAGADMELETGPLSLAAQHKALLWQNEESVARPSEASECQDLFDQFVTLGALQPNISSLSTKIMLRWLGMPIPLLESFLSQEDFLFQPTSIAATTVPLEVAIRTTYTWSETLEAIREWQPHPHLFVDVAYHHTISVGPFVVPGETACIGCLGGRIRQRWRDNPPVSAPLITSRTLLLAGFLSDACARITTGTVPYINAVMTWDSEEGTAMQERVYRVPGCIFCDDKARAGRIDYLHNGITRTLLP